LLVATGWELASALRARPAPFADWPALLATAVATLAFNAFVGFVLGCLIAWLWPWLRGRVTRPWRQTELSPTDGPTDAHQSVRAP
jgi:NhaP-type Na+/H+ or K+/H+ antiporter